MQADAILTAIECIHDAPLAPNGWTKALSAIAAATRSQQATFHAEDASGRAIEFIAGHGLRPDDLARLEAVVAAGESPSWWRSAPLGTVTCRSTIWSDRYFMRSVFYNEFVRDTDSFHAVQVPLLRSPRQHIHVMVARATGIEDYEPSDLSAMQSLVPHLRTAIEVSHRLAATQLLGAGALAALECLGTGLILVDASAGILFANSPALAAIARHGPLGADGQGLFTGDPQSTRLLRRRIADCERGKGAGGCGNAVEIAGAEGHVALRILVVPFSVETAEWDTALCGRKHPAAMLLLCDPQEGRNARAETLRRRFGLTAAEAEVALAILKGDGRAAAAARLGVTVATVRAHLSRIFEKVGVHRQAELVQRILQSEHDGDNQ